MAQEQDGGQQPAPETLDETHRHGDELSTSIFGPSVSNEVETLATLLVAFVANALIAAAKTVAPIHSVTAARPTSRGAPGDRFHDS